LPATPTRYSIRSRQIVLGNSAGDVTMVAFFRLQLRLLQVCQTYRYANEENGKTLRSAGGWLRGGFRNRPAGTSVRRPRLSNVAAARAESRSSRRPKLRCRSPFRRVSGEQQTFSSRPW
jgi:hypothetical protein